MLADAGGIQRLSPDCEYRWKSKPFGAHWITGVFDLDDDGRLEIVTSNGRELILLSASDGTILFRFNVGPSFSYGTYATMFQVHSFFGRGMQILIPCFSHKEVLMFDCSAGAENTRVMHRLWMNDGYHPSTVIGDVNGDGLDEIVIARLGGVYVFSPESGKMISETLWKSDAERRRNYGQFSLADIDNDGVLEAIILSDKVTRHIAVLDNDGLGNFSPLWDRFIQHIYPNDTTELRYTSNSLSDMNADGNLEIVVSLFNARGDDRWYTEVLDPTTGQTLQEYPDRYLRGIANNRICLSEELTRSVKQFSHLEVIGGIDGRALWLHPNARFAERTVHTAPDSSQSKPDIFGEHEVWESSNDVQLITKDNDQHQLRTLNSHYELSPSQFSSSKPFRIAAEDWISVADGTLHHSGSSIQTGYHLTTEAHISARPGNTPIVFDAEGASYLAITSYSNSIDLYRLNNASHTLVAKIPGRGRLGYDNVYHAPSVLKFHGKDVLAIVDDLSLNHARLSLYHLSGNRIKSFEFPELPPRESGNRIGCYDWKPFEHSRGPALFVSFYASHSMNSECSLALLMDTGEILWRQFQTGSGDHGRGVGPWGTSAIMTRDARAHALFCAKDTLCEIDLESGAFTGSPVLLTSFTADAMRALGVYKEQGLDTYSSIDDPFTAYGTPILVEDKIFIAGCFGGMGLLDKDWKLVWWHATPFGDVLYRMPAIGDFNADDRIELVQSHSDGSLRVYDFLTGDLQERIDLGAIPTNVIPIELDGQACFCCGTNDGRLLVLAHDGEKYGILVEENSAGGMGIPVIVSPNGATNVYISSADGFLHSFRL